MTKIFSANWYFFLCLNATLGVPPKPLSWKCFLIHLENFNEVLIIAFSEVIHKKLKKSHIFGHVFLYLFSHILRTISLPLLIFITHILEHVNCVLEWTVNFYHHYFFSMNFQNEQQVWVRMKFLKWHITDSSIFWVC